MFRTNNSSNNQIFISIFLIICARLVFIQGPHRVISSNEAEPDAEHCQDLAIVFTSCFDVYLDLDINSADLGPLEIGCHGANSPDAGLLENDFSTLNHDIQMENIEVPRTQTSSKNMEAATCENNMPSFHTLVGNKISKLSYIQTGPHPSLALTKPVNKEYQD